MIADSTILAFQFIASIFMATDYFFNDAQRKAINAAIQHVIKPIQENVDTDIKARRSYVIQQWVGLLVSVGFLLASWMGVHFLAYLPQGTAPWAMALLGLFFVALLAGGMPKLLELIVHAAIPLTLAGFTRILTSFLLWCPKGTVFGVGFMFLLASFACRYANLQ